MERGLDQLIFFAFIVLAALVDWVVRVIRNRNAPPRPPVPDEEAVYYEDEAEYREEEPAPQWQEAPQPQVRVSDADLPAVWQRALEMAEQQRSAAPRISAPDERPLRPAAMHVPSASLRRSGPPASGASAHGHHWRREVLALKGAGAARRAVVVMAVFGPCRALEDEPRRS